MGALSHQMPVPFGPGMSVFLKSNHKYKGTSQNQFTIFKLSLILPMVTERWMFGKGLISVCARAPSSGNKESSFLWAGHGCFGRKPVTGKF
jgi:hypothetical protein